MTTRLMTIAKELILKPKTGISEKESYFNVHFLNARNEVNEIERILGIELNREREVSQTGKLFTRYMLANAEQVERVASLYNQKLAAKQAKGKLLDEYPISPAQINQDIDAHFKQ